jgi:hypothetical protein
MVDECRTVLGSELHYQAIVYHCLRSAGRVPLTQLGMNVKQFVRKPTTRLFKIKGKSKHPDYRGDSKPFPMRSSSRRTSLLTGGAGIASTP